MYDLFELNFILFSLYISHYRFGGNAAGASIGGAGAARRKNKGPVKHVGDDKKLTSAMKKMNLQDIKGIEEVNLFRDDDSVIHITAPKVQANIPSNTFIVSGNVETKHVYELLPGIVNQLSPELLQKLSAMMGAQQKGAAAPIAEEEEGDDDDDDEIPDLVENFDETAK